MDEPQSSYESPRIREAWASVQAVTLKVAEARLGLHERTLGNWRTRNPDGFPLPIEVAGNTGKLMLYPIAELEFWDDTGRDLTALDVSDEVLYERLQNRNRVQVGKVLPVTLAHAATVIFPDDKVPTAVQRLRVWRDRGVEGMPSPLPVVAAYTLATSIFSMHELQRWWRWFTPPGELVKAGARDRE